MPLEPGHVFFLGDPRAPKQGRLLDMGCGTGNFIAAARDAGFDVTGIEPNQNAVRFAQQHYGLRNVFAALRIAADIERIGDYAANVAKRSIPLSMAAPLTPTAGLAHLADFVNTPAEPVPGQWGPWPRAARQAAGKR